MNGVSQKHHFTGVNGATLSAATGLFGSNVEKMNEIVAFIVKIRLDNVLHQRGQDMSLEAARQTVKIDGAFVYVVLRWYYYGRRSSC